MKWEIYGMPFSPHQSSCSNMKPNMFSWEDVQGDVELWIDSAIEVGAETERRRAKKCAWLCESRRIVPSFLKSYTTDEEGNLKVDGITPTLQKMIDAYDVIFTCDKELVELHDKIQFCFAGSTLPWVWKENWDMHHKEQSISFISSNKNSTKGHQMRHDLYNKIKEFGDPVERGVYPKHPAVFVFGSITGKLFGKEENCHLKGGSDKWHNKFKGLERFAYSIVIENDICSSYFTEKLTDCFVTGTIPIYMGAPDIGDYFDTSGMFIVNSVDEIIKLLYKLNEKVTGPPRNIKSSNQSYEVHPRGHTEYLVRIPNMRTNYHKVTFLESPDDMLYRKISQLDVTSRNKKKTEEVIL